MASASAAGEAGAVPGRPPLIAGLVATTLGDLRQTWRDLTCVNSLWGYWLALIPLMSFAVTPKRGFIAALGKVDTRYESADSIGITLVAVALGLIPALFTVVRRYMAPDLSRVPMALFLWIITLITVSFFPEPEAKDLGLIVLGLFVFALMAVMASQMDSTENIARSVLSSLAVFQTLVQVVALLDNNYTSGRFQGRIGPNYWGSVAASTFLVSFAIRSKLVRALVQAVSLYMLLVSQNRSGILAMAAGTAMIALNYFLIANLRQRLLLVVGVLGGLIASVPLLPIIASKVLLVDSERRGLGSGGTGRFAAWQEAIGVIKEHPILGVGYRHHEHYITVASSAHNAYLAVTADMGVIGLITYLVFLYGGLFVAMIRSLRYREWSYAVIVGVLAGYGAVNMLETRAINFANSVSLAVIACVCLALRERKPQ